MKVRRHLIPYSELDFAVEGSRGLIYAALLNAEFDLSRPLRFLIGFKEKAWVFEQDVPDA